MDSNTRARACVERTGVSFDTAHKMIARDVETCERIVKAKHAAWEAHNCAQGEHDLACTHLRQLWDARHYAELARAGAPVEGAWPCKCNGTGRFQGGGVVENGVYKGYEGECYGCQGKGWQSDEDKQRNHDYWAYYARVYA